MGMDYSQNVPGGLTIMNEINIIGMTEDFPDDAKLVITPEYLLYQIISDYGINPGEWVPKIWEHIFEDFMAGLEEHGIVSKVSGEEG